MGFVSYFPGRGTLRETAYLEGRADGLADAGASAEGRVRAEAEEPGWSFRERAYLEGKADGLAEARAGAEAKGMTRCVLLVLDARGIPVPDTALERIVTCADSDLAMTWLERSLTGERAQDLFADS
ncbi:hypothetical protein AB0O01_12685 [Streptomyces sp. NPDC093252]|uniref:hypothetical protein n=1 Tax=Streptomyces sp. NPDC093252 TaxID=3154980 RepID=UPI003449C67F